MVANTSFSQDRQVLFDAADPHLLQPAFGAYKIIGDNDGDEKDDGADVRHARQGSSARSPSSLPVRESSYAMPCEPMKTLGDDAGSSSRAASAGYKQLKDWASIVKLVPGKAEGQAAYVSATAFVMLIAVDATAQPTFFPIHRISSSIGPLQEEPELVALTENQWLLSDGNSDIVLLETTPQGSRWTGKERARWTISPDSGVKTPMRLRAAQVKDDEIQAVVQSIRRDEGHTRSRPGIGQIGTAQNSSGLSSQHVSFDICLVSLALRGEEKAFEALSRYTSEEPPYDVQFSRDNAVLSIGETAVRLRQMESNSSEIRQDGPLSSSINGNVDAMAQAKPRPAPARVPPFAWLQTSDTVTIAFKLPARLRKTDIRCSFHAKQVDLSISPSAPTAPAQVQEITGDDILDQDEQQTTDYKEANLRDLERSRYSKRPLWAEIDHDSSVWTWERPHGQEDFGLLTLHLEKKHVGTRWVSAFQKRSDAARTVMAATGEAFADDDDDDDDDAELEDVPETIDPSELLNMLDGMEKYTADEGAGIGARSLSGANNGVPASLLEDGLEEEDANVGRTSIVSLLTSSNEQQASPSRPEIMLAQSLPATSPSCATSLVVRRELDGLYFACNSSNLQFRHVDIFPALSYVLASKRQTQQVYVYSPLLQASPSRPASVLAFEGAMHGASTDSQDKGSGAGNLFVYYSPMERESPAGDASPHKKRKLAKNGQSRVLRLGMGGSRGTQSSGHFVGACAVRLPGESSKDVLLVLCQHRLLILDNVL